MYLAGRLGKMALHVFNERTPTPPPVVASLQDRFRRTLSAGYAIDTVLTYEFSWQNPPPRRPDNKPERPILYGKLSFVGPSDPAEGVSLDVGSLVLPSNSNKSTFSILYDSTSGNTVDKGYFHPYEITHIQRMPQPDLVALGNDKIDRRYRETQWLKFIQSKKIKISKYYKREHPIPIEIPLPTFGPGTKNPITWECGIRK
jgi:hypothetical protein